MPAYSKEREQYLIERIREILALKQNVSGVAIQQALANDQKDSVSLDVHYINKLRYKIAAERINRFNEAKVQARLAEIQDRSENVITQMWKVLLDPRSKDSARVAAGKAIIDADHKFLEAQMNAGIFERKLGTLEIERRNLPLTPERKQAVLAAMKNWGLLPIPKDETKKDESTGSTT